MLVRKQSLADEIAALDVRGEAFRCPPPPMKPGSAEEKAFRYEGRDFVAPDNAFETRFARFLEDAPDVERFAKLPSQFGFAIEYTDSAASLRYYEPDFVAVLDGGGHRLVEAKGREDADVAHKDRAARLWCENATALTGTDWQYVKVPQLAFEKLEPERFDELGVFLYEWAR